MPTGLTTTLIAAAFLAALLSIPVVAGVFIGLALAVEIGWIIIVGAVGGDDGNRP